MRESLFLIFLIIMIFSSCTPQQPDAEMRAVKKSELGRRVLMEQRMEEKLIQHKIYPLDNIHNNGGH